MGIFGVIGKMAGSKIVEKVEDELTKKQNREQTSGYAKYYKNTFVQAYMNEDDTRTRTSHLNQLRGYLLDSEFEGGKIGALLYPMVNNDLKTGKVQRIKGTPILVKTINLNDDWRDIETDMLDFVKRIEQTYQRL